MPNHVRTILSIFGPEEDLDRFANRAWGRGARFAKNEPLLIDEDELPTPLRPLSFHEFLPIPDGLLSRTFGAEKEERAANMAGELLPRVDGHLSGYAWCVDNWGTKWDAYEVEFGRPQHGLLYKFTTAWGPPIEFLKTVSGMYPDCVFAISYGGEGPVLGRSVFVNGEELEGIDGPEWPRDLDDDDVDAYYEWENQFLYSHSEWAEAIRKIYSEGAA